MKKYLSDLEIAHSVKLKPITEIAKKIGLADKHLEPYGRYKAKILPSVKDKLKSKPNGKYIVVTAITPTPLGEGKTVNTIGLSLGLNKIGKRVITCIRQPSLGPVFGIKGGAAGGGYSQVLPMEEFNLHLTGDVHAVGLAHNLAAAFLDNSVFKNNKLDIDINTIGWRRVLDVSDRMLRNITIGLGGKDDGYERKSGFDITVASEVMAILALASDLQDLRKRLGRIVLAFSRDGKAITTEDIKVAGAMAALMRDAIKPNLLQTTEHTPCFVHAGPFGNIAHGNSSIIADRIALKLADYVVTEAGFGADLGAEKFFNIKCRASGLKPNAAALVCSIRALKMHSGRFTIVAGKPLDPALSNEDLDCVERGCSNLIKQIENVKLHGIPCVVAINRFTGDSDKEIKLIQKIAKNNGADDAVISDVWAKGGAGGTDLAKAIVRAAEGRSNFKVLYPDDISIKDKISAIATKIYGAGSVVYEKLADEKIEKYTKLGFDKFPICMAKTHLSLTDDPKIKGAPRGFAIKITDVRASVGAGFIYPLCGEMRTMPGLPSRPAGDGIDIDKNGNIIGLS